jgi:methylated-DNA-[protein]-cysteine S-methyltransferase
VQSEVATITILTADSNKAYSGKMAMSKICQKTGTVILNTLVESPIGVLKLSSCQSGLHTIEHDDQFNPKDENFTPNLSIWNCDNSETKNKTPLPLQKTMEWVQNYFQAPEKLPSDMILGMDEFCFPNSTEFEQEVLWTLYKSTQIGDTVTYQQLAGLVNRPNASRAVGTVMKKNPIPIIIPCHRVVRSDGNIGNYSGGKRNKIKEFLLSHEQASLKK